MLEIKKLIEQYGVDAVTEAVEKLTARHIPKTSTPLVDEDKLQATIYQLDTAVADILAAGNVVEETYQNKAELLKRARQLDTEIQLVEAAAVMEIQGTGKDAFVMHEGKKVAITNDTSRDAFRRTASNDLRKQRSEIEAEITKLDIEQARARDAYNAKLEAFQGIRVKANLQANILASLV